MSTDSWRSGEAYDAYIGRWSYPVAEKFIRWLSPASNAHWLDVGCGTGALTRAILGGAHPAAVDGVDPSEAHVAFASAAIADPRSRFTLGDAASIPENDGAYDFVVSGLVLNFIPDPDAALAELRRVARPGASVAAYVWDYADGMQMIRWFWDAAADLDPSARPHDEGTRFPLCSPERLQALWERSGLAGVEVAPVVIPTVFRDFDDYWVPFLGGQGPAPGYAMALAKDDRARLRERLRERLCADADGFIRMSARAWAVRGQA